MRLLSAMCAALCAALPAAAADFTELPWDLRPYYEFTVDNTAVRYASDNAEWDLQLNPTGMLAERVAMSVTLKDGREISNVDLEPGKGARNRAEMEQGAGVHYATTLPSQHGLTVRHSFFVNTNRPFYLIDVQLTNTSDAPIEISRITPVIFKPGSFSLLGQQAAYTERALTLLGAWPVFDPQGAPLSVMLRDDPANFTMVMGLMPNGQAVSRPRLYQAAGGWQGDVVCEFNPPVTIQPGQSISSDPVWICFALPDLEQVDILFAWTHSKEPRKYNAQDMLDAWATAPALEDASALYAAQKAWMGLGVRHTLVPDGWEGRPGSLAGATPRYPEDMRKVEQTIRKTGGFPGLTIDPLLTSGGGDAFTAVTDAGTRYVNLAHPDGYAHALERMRTVVGWGFDFYVVAPSQIPEQVLAHFGVTRRQSEALAVRVMEEAALGKLVYPAPRASLGADLAQWQQADAASQRMYEFAMAIGPVRMNAADAYSAELIEAITNYDGPVELVGVPSASARKSLAGVFPRKNNEYLAKLPRMPRGKELEAIEAEQAAAEAESAPVAEAPPAAEPAAATAEPKPEKSGGFFQNMKNRVNRIVN